MPNNETLDALLTHDAVAAWEETHDRQLPRTTEDILAFLTGGAFLGALLDDALRAQDDTGHSNTVENYLRIVQDLGFEVVYQEPFTGKDWKDGEPRYQEQLYLLACVREGLLLRFDTFGGGHVNSAALYFNWCRTDQAQSYTTPRPVPFSGGYARLEDGRRVCAGHIDAREALRYHLGLLREQGTFVTPWAEVPHLWLLHYMDTDGKSYQEYDSDAISTRRLLACPEAVRHMIATPDLWAQVRV